MREGESKAERGEGEATCRGKVTLLAHDADAGAGAGAGWGKKGADPAFACALVVASASACGSRNSKLETEP